MARAYLDTPFLYLHFGQAHGSTPRLDTWRHHVAEAVGDDARVISALVIDELAYRMILAWLRDAGDSDPLSSYRRAPGATTRLMASRLQHLWDQLDELRLETALATDLVISRAKALMRDPGLAPRDAFHAAHAIEAGCELIVSPDTDYDAVDALRRIGP